MKQTFFQNGQRIIKQILDWLQTSKEQATLERVTDYTDPGSVKDLFNGLLVIPGTNNTLTTPSITIQTGVAYDNVGERILVDNESIAFDPTAPSHTTDDGLGNFISTPRSTGTLNVPLTANTTNYVWLTYLQTVDDSVFTLHKITNARQFYKRTDGYQVTVTTSNIAPFPPSVKICDVDLTGGNTVSSTTINLTTRPNAGLKYYRSKVKTIKADKSDRPGSMPFETEIFIDDHVKAVGSGTPSNKNPHGMIPEDIGALGQVSIEAHQQFYHDSGLIANSQSITSSLYSSITTVNPGQDFITVRKLIAGEKLLLNGTTFDELDFPADTSVLFLDPDTTGTYYIYVDQITSTIQKTGVNLVLTPDQSKFLLCSVFWTNLGPGDGDLSTLVDYRRFGTVGPRQIQYAEVFQKGTTLQRPASAKPGHLYINDTLANIERFNGTSWDSIAINFAPGTRVVFYQASAPIGWVQVVTQNDKALRVVSTAGGGTGGTMPLSSSLAHSHTVDAHTHIIGAHTHVATGGNVLTFSTPVAQSYSNSTVSWNPPGLVYTASDSHSGLGGSGPVLTLGVYEAHTHSVVVNNSTAYASGSANPGTDTQLNFSFQYIDVIVCEKQ